MKQKEQQNIQVSSWRRNTILFMTSQAVTLFGSSLVQMAIIWQVALETSSGVWVTLLTLSATVPQTILSFFAGVWADRYSKKHLIIIADISIAAVTFILAVIFLSGRTTHILPLLLVVSALRSLGTGIQTPAVSAVIPQIVPEEHLMRYNGIHSSIMSIVQFAAPAAAGAVLYLGPFYAVLLIDVITAAVGTCILGFVRLAPMERQEQKGAFFAEMREGLSYAAADPLIRRLLLVFGAFIFLCVPSSFLAVLLIERTFGDNYIFLTINEMAGFAGMVLGGLLLGIWGGFKKRQKTLLLGLGCYGFFSVLITLANTFWMFAVLMFAACLFIPVVQSSLTTMLQEHTEAEKQGRVFGLLGAMYSGFMPVGMVIFGPLADIVKIQWMIIGCGILIIVLGIRALKQI